MRRVLLTAGAILILGTPAFADEVTIEKKTITREVPQSGSTVPTVIVAPNPPPPPRAEAPPPPRPGVVWMSGHWRWSPETRNYVWLEGKFAAPPRPRAAWLPGRWIQRTEGWVWEDGRWD